jgi:uncharacterized membrane protein YvlD (DUF360 family)
LRVILAWLVGAAAVFVAATIVPGVSVGSFSDALLAAALIAAFNAVLPPIVAALRLPYTVALGFLLILVLDALILMLVASISKRTITVDGFGSALLASVVIAGTMVILNEILGIDDDETYTLRVIRRVARRQGGGAHTDVPGIVFLEIDGLGLPVLQRAMRDGTTPILASWLERGTYRLTEWETDLSSQTGASQAGILLGANDDIPAFRWVEKETGEVVACSSPGDCADMERRLRTGHGLLTDDGASRGNLFSGEADAMILTVSRMAAEKRANPGYRAFLANGFNVARLLVLFVWEIVLEVVNALQQRRRKVWPRGHRGGRYPLIRATVCVAIRDLIVFGVLTDMMGGRPAVYATFSSYDEVAHHSGLERRDTLEALRKLDQQFGRIERARRFAPRPYHLVVLSDHGQTQGATFKQRNENDAKVGQVMAEATGHAAPPEHGASLGGEDVVVLASGNLGLAYLMESKQRLSMEEIATRHPRLLPALRAHPHIGFVLVHSREHGPVVLGRAGTRYLAEDRVEGDDPLRGFGPRADAHLRRTDGFANAPDVLVNSFYDPVLEQGCAFEELISFHGGLGGPQTRPFIFHPVELAVPEGAIVGAAAVHGVLRGWRTQLQEERPASQATTAVTSSS